MSDELLEPVDIFSLDSLEENERQLLKNICLNVGTSAASKRSDTKKNWDGRVFKGFINWMPDAHHQKFLELLRKDGVDYKKCFKRLNYQGIGIKTAERVFCSSAKAQNISLKRFLKKYVEYCHSTAEIELKAFEHHSKTVLSILSLDTRTNEVTVQSSASGTGSQPAVTIPRPKAGNDNYYANVALEVIGREAEQKKLKDFLAADGNVLWLQLAGVAGQGKSRLAFDLVRWANDHGWASGFLRENDISYFSEKWQDWLPNKPHLLVFDYVVGRESEIKPIIQALTCRQDGLSNKVRILLVERQPWNQGSAFYFKAKSSRNDSFSMRGEYKSAWFLKICANDDFDGDLLSEHRFENGVVELKNLTEDELLRLVKRLLSIDCSISDQEIKETLAHIDSSGRPLYAYLLAQQLKEDSQGSSHWTKLDLLSGQLKRDKRRWEKAFPQGAPTWGDDHPAMRLAVLASIARSLHLDGELVVAEFGRINSGLGNQALAIVSANHSNSNERPIELHSIEPDLLGEWFVLYCFHQGLPLTEIMDMAWRLAPNETAEFLQRLSQDFPTEPVTTRLLDQSPPTELSSYALSNIAVQIISNLHKANCSFPRQVVIHLENSAKAGNGQAMVSMGNLFFTGKSVSRDEREAYLWYQKAADVGDAGGMAQLGFLYHTGTIVVRDYGKAYKWYFDSAKMGHGGASAGLGMLCSEGLGVKQNHEEAFSWFLNGAKQGNGAAMTGLGNCYFDGNGVEKSKTKAFEQYVNGSKAGDPEAMYNVGMCYGEGVGVGLDISESFLWYHKAAQAGNVDAMDRLGVLYYDGQGVDQSYENAVKWFKRGALKGGSNAMTGLGVCYENGHGVDQDYYVAFQWFRRAAGKGEVGAMGGLGFCYEKGYGVEQNHKEAFRWYKKGARGGNSEAMIGVSRCYKRGLGVCRNDRKADEWYQKHLIKIRELNHDYSH